MFRRALTIAAAGMLGMAVLALVTVRVGALFGAGARLDAYLVGVSGPALLLSLMTSVMSSALTPRLSGLDSHVAALKAGQWALLVFVITGLPMAAIILCRSALVDLLAPGLSVASSGLAARVVAIYAVSLPSTLAASVYAAYGLANGRVWTGGLSTAAYGLAWLTLLFLPPFTGSVTEVAVACVIATQVQLLVAFLCCAIASAKPWPRWRLPRQPRAAASVLCAVGFTVALSKANIILDPILGSFLGSGDVSLLVYAARMLFLIVAVAGQGPALAVLGGRRGKALSNNPLAPSGLGMAVLVAVGLSTAVAIVFEPVAGVLLGHGQFTVSAARHVGRIVEAYGPAAVLITVAWSLEATIFSLGKTWRLVLLNIPTLVVNVGVSLALLHVIGVMARPVAVGVSTLLYVTLLARELRGLPGGSEVVAAVPRREAARLLVTVAAVCFACRLAGNRIVFAPAVWSTIALLAAGGLVLVSAQRWLVQYRASSRTVDQSWQDPTASLANSMRP